MFCCSTVDARALKLERQKKESSKWHLVYLRITAVKRKSSIAAYRPYFTHKIVALNLKRGTKSFKWRFLHDSSSIPTGDKRRQEKILTLEEDPKEEEARCSWDYTDFLHLFIFSFLYSLVHGFCIFFSPPLCYGLKLLSTLRGLWTFAYECRFSGL